MAARMKLYTGTRNASSWAMRAWLALREAGLEFDEEVIDIRRPQRFANLRRMAAVSPSATVPALETEDGVIFDSLAIMEFANDACGGRLLPAHPVARARCRAFAAWQHAGLSRTCACISFESAFYPLRRELTASEAAEARRLFETLEAVIAETGGPFLFGCLSLADLALTPTVIRLVRHDVDLTGLPLSETWTHAVLSGPHVRAWLEEADRLPPIWFEQYLPSPPETPKWRHVAADAS